MKQNRFWISLSLIIALLILGLGIVGAQDEPDERFVGQVPAPEFPPTLDWLNVENPLTMDGLRGKIVIFDFWTYGCINCIHMIPVLAQVEEEFAEEVVVIGVHSAKFENEGQTENLRQIVQRYDLHHPVINDDEFLVWRSYGARAWPTVAIIDPRGNVVAMQSGEIPFEAFDQYLSAMIQYYDGLGQDDIDRTPIELALEGAGNPGTPLLFPGKVVADEASNRLFIADTNHHRYVVADLMTNEVLMTIGSGQRGFDDGDFASATFDQPQGMALVDNILYVADVNNHAIRAIDFDEEVVTTIVGTGNMGRGIPNFETNITDLLNFDIRSPWDVEYDAENNELYIAMAGTHQIYALDFDSMVLSPFVGNGREAQFNDTLATSELAQPSGLYLEDGLLYFADSESSTIRVADIEADTVAVVSGTTENNLFDFGDVDGELGVNRLQHALGIIGVPNGDLYIADTYNSKIKVIRDGEEATLTAFGLGGNGGYTDGTANIAQFDEPGGLAYANGNLYVADTNNHVIRVIDLDNGEVSTLQFTNPEALAIETSEVTILGGNAGQGTTLVYEAQAIQAGDNTFVLNLNLPDNFKINDLIDSTIAFDESSLTFYETTISLPFAADDDGELVAEMTLYYCREGEEALCFIESVTFNAPYTVSDEGTSELTVEHTVLPPELD